MWQQYVRRLKKRLPSQTSMARYTTTLFIVFAAASWSIHDKHFLWHEVCSQDAWSPEAKSTQGHALRNVRLVQFTRRQQRPSFDLSASTVPANELFAGGPPKDGIPALTNPKFTSARGATYLRPEDRVIGVANANQAKAYPLRILNYHPLVWRQSIAMSVRSVPASLPDSTTDSQR